MSNSLLEINRLLIGQRNLCQTAFVKPRGSCELIFLWTGRDDRRWRCFDLPGPFFPAKIPKIVLASNLSCRWPAMQNLVERLRALCLRPQEGTL